MRHVHLLLLAVLAAAAMLVPACSDDDPAAPPTSSAPDQTTLADAVKVDLPQNLLDSDAPEAQVIEDAMKEVDDGLDAWMSMFGEPNGPPVAEKAGKWTYTWTWSEESDALTVTLVIEETDTARSFTMSISGTLGGETLVDVVFCEAWALKNGTEGWVRLREPELSVEEWHGNWNWSTDPAGNLTMSMGSTRPGDQCRMIFTVSADGSGALAVYDWNGSRWFLSSSYTWSTDGGGGTYTEYAEDGSVVDSGDWGDSGGDDDMPVATAGMEGTWEYASTETICGTGEVVNQDSGTEVLCAGDAMIDEDDTGFLQCIVVDATPSDCRVECSGTYVPRQGCLATVSMYLDVVYSDAAVSMTGRSTTTFTGANCMDLEDACFDIVSTGQRIGDAPDGACPGKVGKAAVARWLAGKVMQTRP